MKFAVENGRLAVKEMNVKSIATSSIVFVGDTKRVLLTSWFETPPEDVIVGVTPSLKLETE